LFFYQTEQHKFIKHTNFGSHLHEESFSSNVDFPEWNDKTQLKNVLSTESEKYTLNPKRKKKSTKKPI
jgi:hypothetical protein